METQSGRFLSTDNNEMLAWIVSVVRRLRPDVASSGKSSEFFQWIVMAGIREYAVLRQSNALRELLNRESDSGLSLMQASIYLMRKDVQRHFPLPVQKENFLKWFYTHGVREHGLLEMLEGASPRPQAAEEERPFGVNLIGYAYGQLGIGEDLRMTARALEYYGVPFTIINFPPGDGVPQNDRSMADHVGTDAPYCFNIFCLTAMETARFYAEKGADLFRGRYNIGYWPWELARWPDDWADFTRLVDEAWVSTTHIAAALKPVAQIPVHVMPLAVEVEGRANLGRRDFGLPEDAFIFCFSFDLNSWMRRKNPQACLEAFARAFPDRNERVALVVKCHPPAKPHPAWEELKERAALDRRVRIVEQTLPRSDLLALYGICDCYLSLHRAEGFGRGMAEALLLGLDVIATGYSGNMDYCRDNPRVLAVNYNLVPLGSGDYPYGAGQYWAEPDINHAAEQMRICATRKKPGPVPAYPFSLAAAGEEYATRLKDLWESFGR